VKEKLFNFLFRKLLTVVDKSLLPSLTAELQPIPPELEHLLPKSIDEWVNTTGLGLSLRMEGSGLSLAILILLILKRTPEVMAIMNMLCDFDKLVADGFAVDDHERLSGLIQTEELIDNIRQNIMETPSDYDDVVQSKVVDESDIYSDHQEDDEDGFIGDLDRFVRSL